MENEKLEKNEFNDIDDLLKVGDIEEEVKIKNHVIKLGSLSFGDMVDMNVSNMDELLSPNKQIEILAASIKSIDDKELNKKQKMNILSKMKIPLINMLFSKYVELVKKQNDIFEEVKKNF